MRRGVREWVSVCVEECVGVLRGWARAWAEKCVVWVCGFPSA